MSAEFGAETAKTAGVTVQDSPGKPFNFVSSTTPIHNKCTIGGGHVFIFKLEYVKRWLQNRYTQKKMSLSCTPGHALPSSNIFFECNGFVTPVYRPQV